MQPEIYTAAQGLVARQLQLDAISNNIANVNTTGFRETSPFFRAFNMSFENGPQNTLNYNVSLQPVASGVFMHSRQGPMKATGNELDMAIEGDGYFRLETPNGPRYSRAGNFSLNTDGQLINQNGYTVMDTNNQAITLDVTKPVTIGRDGQVVQDAGQIAQIKLVTFNDKENLVAEADTLLRHEAVNPVEQQPEGLIKSGFLEGSNVNIAKQMVNMITMNRAYDANIRTIRAIDSSLNEQAIRGLGPR